jgi:hypothetical protein
VRQVVIRVLALVFLALFAWMWIKIGLKLSHFKPTPEHKTLELDNDLVSFAGFLASAVGAGTAAALGIEIQKPPNSGRLAARAVNAAKQSKFVLIGILGYAAIGVFVLVIWINHTTEAPDVIRAFSWGVAGWLAGAFAASLRSDS